MAHASLDAEGVGCVGEVLTGADGRWWARQFREGYADREFGPYHSAERARNELHHITGHKLVYRDAVGFKAATS